MRAFHITIFIMVFLLVLGGRADALVGDWVEPTEARDLRLRLVSVSDQTASGENLSAGIQFDLGPQWKIYWRYPGDSGLPPRFDFSRSQNIADIELLWPAPQRLSVLGVTSLGYAKRVVFPLRGSIIDSSSAADLQVQSDFLACADICVPLRVDLGLSLPVRAGTVKDVEVENLLAQFLPLVPRDLAPNNLPDNMRLTHVRHVGSDSDYHYYRLALLSQDSIAGGDILVESLQGDSSDKGLSLPQLSYLPNNNGILAEFFSYASFPVDSGMRVTFVGRDSSAQTQNIWQSRAEVSQQPLGLGGDSEMVRLLQASTNSYPVVLPPQLAGLNIWVVLIGFALLGGFILNFMPCVLPALALKVFALTQKDKRDRGAVRAGFLATAAGIVVCFLLIASALQILKLSGGQIGWGIQYQQPVFLGILFVIMTLFAANLFGVFEVRLPYFITALLSRQTAKLSPNQDNAHVRIASLGKDFLLGVLATLLATPCTAPFLSIAVGVALIVGGVELFLIFLCLGLGLAAPYIVVAAFPRCAVLLPRPGAWLVWAKRFLGLLLALTAGWLFFLMTSAHSLRIAVMVAGLTLLAIAYLHVRRRRLYYFKSPPFLLPTLMLVGAIVLTFSPADQQSKALLVAEEEYWQVFDESRIADQVSNGKVVFVDVGADWCVTCKFNKLNVLQHALVEERLRSGDLLAMYADWTRSDSRITAYLRSHARAGVPLNVVYGQSAPQGIILGEILTVASVLEALDRAGRVRHSLP